MDQKPRWQFNIGTFTPFIPLLAIIVGVGQFSYSQRENSRLQFALRSEEARLNYTRALWTEQLSAYKQVAEIVGRIAAEIDEGELPPELVNDYEAAYWGAMILFKDDDIDAAMIALYQELRQYRDDFSNPVLIRQSALRFLTALRTSTERMRTALTQE